MVNFFSESVFFNSAPIHPLPGSPVYDLPVVTNLYFPTVLIVV